jgi:hypothetical protein
VVAINRNPWSQSIGISGRNHPVRAPLLDEHFRVEGRRTWFDTTEEMQAVLDVNLQAHNQPVNQGRGMNGHTPAQAFAERLRKPTPAKEDNIPAKKPAQKHAA